MRQSGRGGSFTDFVQATLDNPMRGFLSAQASLLINGQPLSDVRR
jgi:hypothetical protein